jgi:Domain of Unknown Function (DUF1080)
MKYTTTLNCFMAVTICLFTSCKKEVAEVPEVIIETPEEEIQMEFLPFKEVGLNDLSAFKTTGKNWKIVGNVIADRTKEKTLVSSEGKGVLININDEDNNAPIFTAFEHGDIEIELDVMMPLKSNSGLYFQGRYEVQLFDSWGVKEPQYSDIGGIYQRWDEKKGKGKEGYEGHAPRMNAAKAPGLWQHFKIIFHAPKFDEAGKKIKNARFEEVWLNGVLIHKNIEVTGPTQAAAFEDEKPRGALMIQGDHGPVAIKSIKYKLYEDKKISFGSITNKQYESNYHDLINMDSLKLVSESKVENIDLTEVSLNNSRKIVTYSGTMEIPATGEYLFKMGLNGGGVLIIKNDTIINMNEDYSYAYTEKFGNLVLEKGSTPFTIVYNKKFPWRGEFDLKVEGPEIQSYSIQEPIVIPGRPRPEVERIMVEPKDAIVTQRGFFMHKKVKKVFSIAVGSPIGLHYAYDLSTGSLLSVWDGTFIDATLMWDSRGEDQLQSPNEFHVSSFGGLEFAFLKDDKSLWPIEVTDDLKFKQLGYEFNESGVPLFSNKIDGTTITNTFVPSSSGRKIQRIITIDGTKEIWHKIAEGEKIEVLPNNTYIINNESYYIDFSGNGKFKPIIRNINGVDELLLKVPSGKQSIKYHIIW